MKQLQFTVEIKTTKIRDEKFGQFTEGPMVDGWEIFVNSKSAGISRSREGVAMMTAYYIQLQTSLAMRGELVKTPG